MRPFFASVILGVLRHFPTDRIRWRFLPWGLRLCELNFRMPIEKTFRTRHGFCMCLDVSDWLGRHIYVTGDYENATTRVFGDRLSAGKCMFDIGANAGYFSCLSASLVGSGGRVVSFEPVPRLKKN